MDKEKVLDDMHDAYIREVSAEKKYLAKISRLFIVTTLVIVGLVFLVLYLVQQKIIDSNLIDVVIAVLFSMFMVVVLRISTMMRQARNRTNKAFDDAMQARYDYWAEKKKIE